MILRFAPLATIVVIACNGDPARVELAPVDHPCGKPAGARNIRVFAYGTAGEAVTAVAIDDAVEIASFPADTEQIGIEIEVGGGQLGAIGKTAPLDFLALETGDQIPIYLAPPNGFCPTLGEMSAARIAPLVARAGEGVLVVGGHDGLGTWHATADFYDPVTSTFTPVLVPEVLGELGFEGTSIATLPDGRVALSGGPRSAITLFDPVTKTFGESVLVEARTFHASIALDDTHLWLAGGCSEITGMGCALRRSSKIYDLTEANTYEIGPNLRVARIGAQLLDVGVQDDAERGFVLAGGTSLGAPDGADRVSLGTAEASELTNVRGHAAVLDGGAVLTAFAPDGEPPSGVATVIVPALAAAHGAARAPDRTGVRLIALEDGRVLGVGGDANGDVLRYDPTVDRWQSFAPAGSPPPGALAGASLVRLADGSVLVLGSPIAGAASASAWIFRPSLVGPANGSVTASPDDASQTALTASDPSTIDLEEDAYWTLTGTDVLARALVGGPRTLSGTVSAGVTVVTGGVALIAQQVGPGRALVGELVPGSPARILRLDGSTERVLCTGRDVPALGDDQQGVQIAFELDGATARLRVGDVVHASCEVDATERGAWGVAARPLSEVRVGSVRVAR